MGPSFSTPEIEGPRYTLAFLDRTAFHLSKPRAEAYQEHRLSFTDCTKVVFIQQMRLDGIFAFDDGYSRVGMDVLP